MSDMEHSDKPTPATPGNPPSTETAGSTEAALGTPTEPAGSTPDVSTETTPIESAPADVAPPPNVQERPKTKGVADIVFMVDISGSMAPCIDALRSNIEAFIDSLSKGEANNAPPIRDWRGKVVGYRDIEAAQSEGLPWIVDAPFVRDAGELKTQLSQLRAEGGGDEPESLLDALFKTASMEATPKGSQSEDPNKWRYR